MRGWSSCPAGILTPVKLNLGIACPSSPPRHSVWFHLSQLAACDETGRRAPRSLHDCQNCPDPSKFFWFVRTLDLPSETLILLDTFLGSPLCPSKPSPLEPVEPHEGCAGHVSLGNVPAHASQPEHGAAGSGLVQLIYEPPCDQSRPRASAAEGRSQHKGKPSRLCLRIPYSSSLFPGSSMVGEPMMGIEQRVAERWLFHPIVALPPKRCSTTQSWRSQWWGSACAAGCPHS